MARKSCIHVPGSLYHVMMRGNGGEDIFFDDDDRYHFYLLIQQGVERYGHRIHGFCCMTIFVHFVIQVSDIPLSKIIQNLSFRYTRYINQVKENPGFVIHSHAGAREREPSSYFWFP